MEKRKHYLDNIRWITLCFVIIYHIFYIFNSSGVVSNIGVTGIKELDSICVFIYPWIMCLLFVVSGVSTNYSLKSKTNKEFIKDRAKRILVPSLIGIFVYGWISGWTTNYYGDIFAGNGSMIPAPIKYIIFSLIGIGPLWYAHVLFIASLLIVLVRKIDKNKKLDILFSKINLPLLFSLVLLVWGSSFILNTPVVTVYRFGIYEDRKVKDATGAGDAFGSGFLACYTNGKSFRSSLIFASANSTAVVTKLGANRGALSGNEPLHPMPIQKL